MVYLRHLNAHAPIATTSTQNAYIADHSVANAHSRHGAQMVLIYETQINDFNGITFCCYANRVGKCNGRRVVCGWIMC